MKILTDRICTRIPVTDSFGEIVSKAVIGKREANINERLSVAVMKEAVHDVLDSAEDRNL